MELESSNLAAALPNTEPNSESPSSVRGSSEPSAENDPCAPASRCRNQKDSQTPRHRRGIVARLRADVRREINQMLDDGLPFAEIINNLGDVGEPLAAAHIGSWKAGGYQDYLRQQRFAEQCQQRRTKAYDLITRGNQINGFQAAQQIANTQICETLAEVGNDILREALAANPLNYFRMLNSFSRLVSGSLKCERHLSEAAERKAKLKAQKRPRSGGITAEALAEAERKLNLL